MLQSIGQLVSHEGSTGRGVREEQARLDTFKLHQLESSRGGDAVHSGKEPFTRNVLSDRLCGSNNGRWRIGARRNSTSVLLNTVIARPGPLQNRVAVLTTNKND